MNNHHAYLYQTSGTVDLKAVESQAEIFGIEDVTYIYIQNFGIGDVRDITLKAYVRPQIGGTLLIAVGVDTITSEAQQALLKILEEPPQTTIFLFCIPRSVFLLPTLLSRFSVVDTTSADTQHPVVITEAFLSFMAMTAPERIEIIGKKLTAKDTVWMGEIKNGLCAELSSGTTHRYQAIAKDLYFVAEHLMTRGAANKHLLEELALTLPRLQKNEKVVH